MLIHRRTAALPPERSSHVSSGTIRVASPDRPLHLEHGATLVDAEIAYEVIGPAAASSVVLVCHALTGDAHVARHQSDDRPGWWETLVGPGRAIDTDRHTVICSNVLGGCSGSTGPASIDPCTGEPYGPDFPLVTIGDMVEAQSRLLDAVVVDGPIAVVGGSIGGFQALEWVRRFPERVASAAVIASAIHLGAFGLAFNNIGRNAIRVDPRFNDGRYTPAHSPSDGLAVARQLAHLTYRTASSFDERFGRRLTEDVGAPRVDGHSRYEVHRYLAHKGESFSARFDANTYIRLTEAMDAYDANGDGLLAERLAGFNGALLSIGYSSDWLFPPDQSLELASVARAADVRTKELVLQTDQGHDAFLMSHEGLTRAVANMLDRDRC